jgi:hypothetical protein
LDRKFPGANPDSYKKRPQTRKQQISNNYQLDGIKTSDLFDVKDDCSILGMKWSLANDELYLL